MTKLYWNTMELMTVWMLDSMSFCVRAMVRVLKASAKIESKLRRMK